MTAKDIIKNVCIYLGKEEILASNLFNLEGEELGENAKKDLDLMMECLNFVTDEIASEYLPIYRAKIMETNHNKIKISDIANDVQDIISVKNKVNKSIKFNIIDGNIICVADKVNVIYSVYPKKINIESDFEYFDGVISARVLAYGTASEYCFIQMLHSDANIWETRYKSALLADVRKKGSIYLKGRSWY